LVLLTTDRLGKRARTRSTSSKEAIVVRIALVAALVLAPAAFADGGPSPGVDQGSYGLLSVNGAVRYATLSGTRSTVLEAIRTSDGHVLRWRTLDGGWGIPFVTYNGTTGGLARNGRTLVLAESAFSGGLRDRSVFAVVDPKTFGFERITLGGDFAFDAISPDARRLYVIEHVSATNFSRYLVREYDLQTDRLLPGAIADRTQRGWVMEGAPVARATSANGRFVYTLYQNPGGYPFVHALDTARARAHCIGLPWRGNQNSLYSVQLSLGHGGRTLNVGDSFRIDTRSYRLVAPGAPGQFPWWALAFAPLPLVLLAASRRARVTSTIASRSATAMCSSGVWISAIPFARFTHRRPRSLKTLASAAPPDKA
jgi:hypothetical protein